MNQEVCLTFKKRFLLQTPRLCDLHSLRKKIWWKLVKKLKKKIGYYFMMPEGVHYVSIHLKKKKISAYFHLIFLLILNVK